MSGIIGDWALVITSGNRNSVRCLLKLEIHPQASQNYNKKAEERVSRLSLAPDHLIPKDSPANPDIHTVHTFTLKNIIGEMRYGWTDFIGNVVARAFGEGDHLLGLFGEDHLELTRVAEGLQKKYYSRPGGESGAAI
jgi:hypothetical protein